jgi:hypothetical protein
MAWRWRDLLVGLYVPLLEFKVPVAEAHAEKLNSCGLSVEMNFRASLRASYCAKRSAPRCPALCVRTPTVDPMSSCDAPEVRSHQLFKQLTIDRIVFGPA